MKHIIIEQPHLQSLQQRLGYWLLAFMSWLLWLYFLLPLFTLAGWLMGFKTLSDEIRWFGGYKRLIDLLWLYGETVALIAIGWLIWTVLLSWLHRFKPTATLPVSDERLAKRFGVDMGTLIHARGSQTVTVHFDDQAVIVRIDTRVN
ncbi:MAG: poly-beta-1,6-N-acetyl-D-glucosamine biosynthesis protein PgaD [Methylomonas sp.]|nr:poly-beta-1,6-N-acetyl-D-glucosamine biosynthesis protein PgaD [Methylomonas sp.]PPD19393.1 MAG: poly-beta-1,6-N-acetyl-D-glucosamine biosynthesis protein PgaD [Methylomonas sp.]PPD24332.1 MAG: poly-beta-1,6-N-acetyl-D-glucosamine biosynthesis protein PgaD [Methylomonas sp.]PPD32884.1 MAG: poly-beta-1,6-N-acetyl-D-glucosamine biosynthesis protein PgaD [Methylomonas sp.]PPD54042.1 MAG: poly-beta-1,6-N-acetyl-D-glucosamine biosynthesis protein PgaD [Methylomonas sp.]